MTNTTNDGKANRFKNASNAWLTQRLFYEMSGADKTGVLYTLKEEDHEGYPSLYRLYMETNDLTEYAFATKYLGGWSHWKVLSEASWFKPYAEAWREELEVKARSVAVANIMRAADAPGRDGVSAAKYIAEKGWVKPTAGKRGPVAKQKIQEEAQLLYEKEQEQRSDLERLLN